MWHTEIANDTVIFGKRTVRVAICDELGVEIARTSGLFPADEEWANATKLAAAPDLLAALEETIPFVAKWANDNDSAIGRRAVTRAEAAIAKAKP